MDKKVNKMGKIMLAGNPIRYLIFNQYVSCKILWSQEKQLYLGLDTLNHTKNAISDYS